MTSKLTSLLTAAAVAGGLAFASTVFAQGTPPTPAPPEPTPPAEQGAHGMMKGEGMNGSGMMLAERPPIKGLAAPGMPRSAPGMDQPGYPYEVVSFGGPGEQAVFARH